MMVTLSILVMEDKEPKLAIFSNKARLEVKGLEHTATKPFTYNFCFCKMGWSKDSAVIEGEANQ